MQNDDKELLDGINSNGDNQGAFTNTTTPVTNTPPVVKTETPGPRPAAAKQAADFWDEAILEDEAPDQPKNVGTETTGTEAAGTTDAPAATPAASAPAMQKVTSAAVATSARTAVATINLAQVTLLKPVLNWRFKKESEKRFGEHLPRLQDMVMGEIPPTDEAERARKKKFEKFLKERDAKVKGLPFTDDEEKDMESAFRQYFQMKQVTMSPEVLLVCSLATTIGSRVIDVAIWD